MYQSFVELIGNEVSLLSQIRDALNEDGNVNVRNAELTIQHLPF